MLIKHHAGLDNMYDMYTFGPRSINSMVPGGCDNNFDSVIFSI